MAVVLPTLSATVASGSCEEMDDAAVEDTVPGVVMKLSSGAQLALDIVVENVVVVECLPIE